MKKGWFRYLLAELVAILLVVSFFWISHLIQVGKVYHLSVATLLGSYKENLLVFIKKYDNHVVYLTGKVFHVSEQDPENYVLLQGTEYIGSYFQMIDPNFKIEKTASEYQENSVRCAIDNKYLTLFEESQYSEDIVTIKGILHVNTTEVILKDCIKVEDPKPTLPSFQNTSQEFKKGNGAGNIVNGGLFAIQGEWIYYAGPFLKKMKIDGSIKTSLNQHESSDLNVQGDWIYYHNQSENNNIYRIRTDGSERHKVE